jgi:hypothetical protein
MRIVRLILISIVVSLVPMWYLAWNRGWLNAPELPPKEQVTQTEEYCAQLAGYDDGATDDERLAIAVATINRARASRRTTCEVYKSFASLIGPERQPLVQWHRETQVMYAVSKLSADRLALFNQTGLLLKKYLADPTEDVKRFPWLTCVEYYRRSTWRWATPWPDKSLGTDSTKLVWISSFDNDGVRAEFFCPTQ